MKQYLSYTLLLACLAIGLSSCKSSSQQYDNEALAQASVKLGIDINEKDNYKLYTNAAEWIGTPYHAGGTDQQGIDCTGLTVRLYKATYNIRLPRKISQQRQTTSRSISLKELYEGDLVFFSDDASRKKTGHVGVYLKDGKFIHASNQGVIVSDLDESYYKEHFLCGGRFYK